jgi:hypothetical protein
MRRMSILQIDLKRAFLSWRFLFSTVGIAITMLVSSTYLLFTGLPSAYQVYSAAMGRSGSELLTLILLPLLPYSLSFAADWNAHAIPYWTVRVGARKYCASRLLASALSAWAAVFLGLWLFVLLLLPFFPLHIYEASGGAYGCFLQEGRQELFFLFEFAHQAFTSLFFSSLAILVSACVPDPFLSLAFPFGFYLVGTAVSQYLKLPLAVNLGVAMLGSYNAGTPLASLAVKAVNMLLRSALLGLAAGFLMRRRLQ